MRKPTPTPRFDAAPHGYDREGRQAYAKELEDYAHGVAVPPEEQIGQGPNRRSTRELSKKRHAAV